MPEIVSPLEALTAVVRVVAEQLPEDIAGPVISQRMRDACAAAKLPDVVACAHLLFRVGFTCQAETLFQVLAQCFPTVPAGAVGLAHVAMDRESWPRALSRWSYVIATYPSQNQAYFLSARARVLNELGCSEEATANLDDVLRNFADQPFGYMGLAQLAMRQRRWGEALSRWDEVLALFPQHNSSLTSKVGRASALIELARYADAEASLREVVQADPWIPWAQIELMRVLVLSGQPDQAMSEIENGPLANVASPKLIARRIQILSLLRQTDAARVLFTGLLHRAVGFDSIAGLFNVAPELYEGWQLTETWLELLRRFDQLPDPVDVEDRQIFDVMRARIQLALRDYCGFLGSAARIGPEGHLGEVEKTLRAVVPFIEDPSFPDFKRPKVLGIGLSKTGTTSLAAALSALGLNTAHWRNTLTRELISEPDFYLFDALTDTPVCLAFEKFYYMFPASKFIYTIRPLDTWLVSLTRQWQRSWTVSDFGEFQRAVSRPDSLPFGNRLREIFLPLYLNHASLQEAYAAYDRRVRSFFQDKPRERFLVFDIFAGHGWPELCAFLGTDPPAIPFPRENAAPLRG